MSRDAANSLYSQDLSIAVSLGSELCRQSFRILCTSRWFTVFIKTYKDNDVFKQLPTN